MLSMLLLLPMLRIDAKLPMLRSDAALATDSTLVALSTLHKLLLLMERLRVVSPSRPAVAGIAMAARRENGTMRRETR